MFTGIELNKRGDEIIVSLRRYKGWGVGFSKQGVAQFTAKANEVAKRARNRKK